MPVRLNALDWIVVTAAAVSLIVLVTWMVQGRPDLRPTPAPS